MTTSESKDSGQSQQGSTIADASNTQVQAGASLQLRLSCMPVETDSWQPPSAMHDCTQILQEECGEGSMKAGVSSPH